MRFYYFHGFGSSPEAKKANILKNIIGTDNLVLPDFNLPSGKDVKVYLDKLVKEIKTSDDESYIIGSSLGGLYGLYVSALSGCNALLLNPCLYPQLIIGDKDPGVSPDDIVLAQQLNLTAYLKYDPEKVRVWVAKDDELINHEILTKPFFYKGFLEYRKFPKSKKYGHRFKGFKSIFIKYFEL